MPTTRFRPSLEAVEDRYTPADLSPGGPATFESAAVASIGVDVDRQLLERAARDPGLVLLFGNQPAAIPVLQAIAEQAPDDAAELAEYRAALQREVAADPSRAGVLDPVIERAARFEQQALANAAGATFAINFVNALNAQFEAARQAREQAVQQLQQQQAGGTAAAGGGTPISFPPTGGATGVGAGVGGTDTTIGGGGGNLAGGTGGGTVTAPVLGGGDATDTTGGTTGVGGLTGGIGAGGTPATGTGAAATGTTPATGVDATAAGGTTPTI